MSRQFNPAVLDEFKILRKDAEVWVEPSRCSAPFLATHTHTHTHVRAHTHASAHARTLLSCRENDLPFGLSAS